MDARRPRLLELGLFLIVVAAPLVFTPFTSAPFMDAKLLLLALGALALSLGGVTVDRRLAAFAAVWVAVTAIATLTSVDPLSALNPSRTGGEGGIIVTAAAATLIVVGAGLPGPLVERLSRWLAWTGVAIAAITWVYRLAPDALRSVSPRVDFVGATMGSQLFVATVVAAAMAAAATDRAAPSLRRYGQIVFMAVAIAITDERSSLVLPFVAVGVALWRSRVTLRTWGPTIVLIAGSFAVWEVVQPELPGRAAPVAAVAQLSQSATDVARTTVWTASARAWSERPILGWGPNTTHTAYIWAATPHELEVATRPWGDAHDLFLETGVGTGVLGLLPLIALLATAVWRGVRCSPDRGWALGAAAAIGAYSLVEPIGVVVTPLLFLFAGIAAGPPRAAWEQTPWPSRVRGPLAALAPVVLAAAVAVAALQFVGSGLQQHGRDEADLDAFRLALRIQPWRLSAQELLALQLALDGRSGNEAAASEARTLVTDAVAARPWDADVRYFGADVDTLLERNADATAFLRDQLDRFPNDTAFVADHRNAPPPATP